MSKITVELKYTSDISEAIQEINQLISTSGKNVKGIFFKKTSLLKGELDVLLEEPLINYKLTNAINRKKTSEYIGVFFDKTKQRWKWQLRHGGKNGKKYTGQCNNEYDAAIAYDAMCYKLRGKEAILNFPELYKVVK